MQVFGGEFSVNHALMGNDIDLIVMGYSGVEIDEQALEEKIQDHRSRFNLPILVLLSTSDHDVIGKVDKMAGVRCLSRPYTSDILLRAIYESIPGMGAQIQLEKEDPSASIESPDFNNRHFLVADDNPVNLQLITTILANCGAEITQADEGAKAVEMALSNGFDLILMDLHMPNLSGLEAARIIRSSESNTSAHTPILALTADVMPETKASVLASGMDDYLIKPIDESALIRVISRHLDGVDTDPGSLDSSAPVQTEASTDAILPVRDMEKALQAAGGKQGLAEQLYARFCSDLKPQSELIRKHGSSRNWDELWDTVHRLRGAAAICALSALEDVMQQLERAALNRQQLETDTLMSRLENEVKQVLLDVGSLSSE